MSRSRSCCPKSGRYGWWIVLVMVAVLVVSRILSGSGVRLPLEVIG